MIIKPLWLFLKPSKSATEIKLELKACWCNTGAGTNILTEDPRGFGKQKWKIASFYIHFQKHHLPFFLEVVCVCVCVCMRACEHLFIWQERLAINASTPPPTSIAYTRTHTHTYTITHTHTLTCMHACTHTHTHTLTCMHTHTHTHTHPYPPLSYKLQYLKNNKTHTHTHNTRAIRFGGKSSLYT